MKSERGCVGSTQSFAQKHPGFGGNPLFLTAWTVNLVNHCRGSKEEGSVLASLFFTELTLPSFSRSLGSRKKGTGNVIFLCF